jgi:hypothetical protein
VQSEERSPPGAEVTPHAVPGAEAAEVDISLRDTHAGTICIIGGMGRTLGVLATVFACACVAAACESGEKQDATTTPPAATGPTLPPAVAKKRDAIVAAAKSFDYTRLRTLLDPAHFSYSFGESGNPIGYWRRLEHEGEVPILGDYLPTILGAPHGRQGDIYVWPAAYAKKPSEWTAEDRRWLKTFYSQKEIRGFEQAGSYLGWRVGIRKDGTWLFFVAGD